MTGFRLRAALLVTSLAWIVVARPLPAAQVAGVTLPETLDVGGRELKLNGTALLKKLVFRVYAVGLYLPAPAHDAGSVVGPDVPKALIIHFLRAVSRNDLVGPLELDFARNGGEKGKRARAQIEKLLAGVKDMKRGDRLTFRYQPGKGSTIAMTDGTTTTFEGKDFADAFLLIYVGPHPPKAEMKRRLLGRA
ncbi:MAG: chalcone isomerase family protein [Thermoanaerobaculia bacterium]